MHKPAVTHGREDHRKRNLAIQDCGAQIAFADGDRVARPKCDLFESMAVAAKGYLTFSATIQIVKDGSRNAPLRLTAKVRNVHETRGRKFLHCLRTVKSISIHEPTQASPIIISG